MLGMTVRSALRMLFHAQRNALQFQFTVFRCLMKGKEKGLGSLDSQEVTNFACASRLAKCNEFILFGNADAIRLNVGLNPAFTRGASCQHAPMFYDAWEIFDGNGDLTKSRRTLVQRRTNGLGWDASTGSHWTKQGQGIPGPLALST